MIHQATFDAKVTLCCIRLIVVVGVDGLHSKRSGQSRHFVAHATVQDNEPSAKALERCVQLDDAVPDELYASVMTRQGPKEFGEKHERPMHSRATLEGVMQGGVVVSAAVSEEPDLDALAALLPHIKTQSER
jgi:hypothetical protein